MKKKAIITDQTGFTGGKDIREREGTRERNWYKTAQLVIREGKFERAFAKTTKHPEGTA